MPVTHQPYNTAYVHARNEQRKRDGRCIYCGAAPPKAGCVACEACLAYYADTDKARRQYRLAQKLCQYCGKTRHLKGAKHCAACRDRRNQSAQTRRLQKRTAT